MSRRQGAIRAITIAAVLAVAAVPWSAAAAVPDFAIDTNTGPFSLAQARGKAVVLFFSFTG